MNLSGLACLINSNYISMISYDESSFYSHAFLDLVCRFHIPRYSKEFEVPADVLGISSPFDSW